MNESYGELIVQLISFVQAIVYETTKMGHDPCDLKLDIMQLYIFSIYEWKMLY